MRTMKYRHLILFFAATFQMVACGKDNPNNGGKQGGEGTETSKNTPAVILQQDFTKGLGAFTVQDKDKGGFSKKIWKYESGTNAKYGAQASASEGSDDKRTNYKSESWLISPEIDLTNYTDANLYFNHAFAYSTKKVDKKVVTSDPKNHFFVKVSADGGVNWTDREIPKWLASHSYFELAQSGNISLSQFKGQKIKIAFVYKSTEEFAPTWEITNMTVSYDRMVPIPDDAGDQFKSVAKGMMEMPAITDDKNFFVHTTILRFGRVRNYSFSYNTEALVSNWVAYPLYDEFSRNNKNYKVSRYDDVVTTNKAWAIDPFLKEAGFSTINVASGDSYEWSNNSSGIVYSRGHQLPSADRLGGAMANIQTFYTSNVTPQASKFNGGIWENLEEAVRGWSSSDKTVNTDTLYVVTGCVVDASCKTLKDHDGKAVAIPKAYYKALLRLGKEGNYIGAGFYLEHKEDIASGDYKDYAMSLKDLEAKTGMTFFVNLPADKAAAIKAEDPKTNKFWNLK